MTGRPHSLRPAPTVEAEQNARSQHTQLSLLLFAATAVVLVCVKKVQKRQRLWRCVGDWCAADRQHRHSLRPVVRRKRVGRDEAVGLLMFALASQLGRPLRPAHHSCSGDRGDRGRGRDRSDAEVFRPWQLVNDELKRRRYDTTSVVRRLSPCVEGGKRRGPTCLSVG